MKYLLVALVFAGVGCSTQSVKNSSRTQSSINEYSVDFVNFIDPEDRIAALGKIKNVFLNPQQNYSAADVGQNLQALSADQDYGSLLGTYTSQTMYLLKFEDVFEWRTRYPNVAGTLGNYIDPQQEDENGEVIWQTTNRSLRNSVPLNKAQKSFLTSMTSALNSLPPARGIVYRGVTLKMSAYTNYKNAKEVTEKSFLSTSLDPAIAIRFSTAGSGEVATVFVIEGHSGRPISFAVPTSVQEAEVLFKPNASFDIVKVVEAKDLKSAYIFLKEKPSADPL